ncbi:predicted protein [Naegleria gruberi]|uniref:adenosine deaminase n=1 Tax=Naegleria gruberi TaxID=5762 RepID=D2V3F7_NAEGR|nr:uncharacterized protein NAEGRDRAFT_37886 [Naegleria gruberi]EFC48763.1 predicted protein [Naegleria gruberi]|eukprot:XP_002681507.1 predicted protein [Naegleria gruberi strain NEG-M]
MEQLIKIPKAELHRHLDGSLRIETMIDLAKRNNISLPSLEINELKKALTIFTSIFTYNSFITNSIERVVYEVCEDAYKDGILYLEIRFASILHTKLGLTLTQVMEYVINGINLAEKELNGFKCRLIVSGLRDLDPQIVYEMAQVAIKFQNHKVVAFDLASRELNYPANLHLKSYQLIHQNYLKSTCHAGEATDSNYIHDSIINCGVQRIGHGTRLFQDENLLKYVRDCKIALEICVTSNYQTKAVNSYKEHPLPLYFKFGIPVCICTDNTLMSNITLSEELFRIQNLFNFTNDEIIKMIRNGFEYSFLTWPEKEEMLNNFDTFISNNKF